MKTKLSIKSLITCLILCLSIGAQAKEIKPKQAQQAAMGFINQHFTTEILLPGIPNDLILNFMKEHVGTEVNNSPKILPLYYVFSFQSSTGFIIVSGDDRAAPILGYSTESEFDSEHLHPEIKKWLEQYSTQIRIIIDDDIQQSAPIAAEWEALLHDSPLKSFSAAQSRGPLLEVKWGQSPYVNDYCPYDSGKQKRAVTGCTQTAMAMVMKYWSHPSQGSGFHSYNHSRYGTLSANFGSTQYNWNNMPNVITGSNASVAELMYHCGVANEADYGTDVTGSWMCAFPSYPNRGCTETSLINYFDYDENLHSKWKSDYTNSQWIAMVKEEIDQDRPLLYRGSGSGGGHAFVCDGYNGNYLHMNWGWSGYYDGYFLVTDLNPDGLGTGGGSGQYNNYQAALFGVKPKQSSTAATELALFDHLTVTPSPVNYGADFTVHTDFANYGASNFFGDFGVAIFDKDINFVEFVEILTGQSLNSGYHYTDGLDFTKEGSLTLLPGSYHLAAFYKPQSEDWKVIANNGDYLNFTDLTISHENDLELWDAFSLSTGDAITRGESFSVHLDVANTGSIDFYGTLDVSLYDLDGNFIELIDDLNNVSLEAGYHFTNGLDFSCQGIQSTPGTYLLAFLYKQNNGEWELGGSKNHTNPIQVIVKEAPLGGDAYENNDSQGEAFLFSPRYTNNYDHIMTPGANIHTGSDSDYYGIRLDGGYTYTLTGRLHDANSSANGQTYTNDALVSLHLDEYSSDTYDDVLPSFKITMYTDGIVYLYVAPYFPGQKGSYLLDLYLSRIFGTGREVIELSPSLTLYPNPAQNELWLDWTDLSDPITKIELLDMSGRVIQSMDEPDMPTQTLKIDISHLPNGLYAIRMYGKELYQRKFTKGN